jgi:ribonuclease P protein component
MREPCRFRRTQRLLCATDFQFVFDQPCRSSDAHFTVLARANQREWGRLGLVIARKHVRLAVARNRLKRLARESFRLNQQRLVGLDCLVLAKKGATETPNAQLLQSLARHWQFIVRRCHAQKSSPPS